jgi:hypothetical protein
MMENDVSISLFFFGCAVLSDMVATPFGAHAPYVRELKLLRNTT